jgi:hypothetical protein
MNVSWYGWADVARCNPSEYFGAANSSLNPSNRGMALRLQHVPMFIAAARVDFRPFRRADTQVGRRSRLVDLLTVAGVPLAKLYDRRGDPGSGFFGSSGLPFSNRTSSRWIPVNFFSFLAFCFAVLVVTGRVNGENGCYAAVWWATFHE